MLDFSLIILGNEFKYTHLLVGVETIFSDGTNILEDIKKVKTTYVGFINSTDKIDIIYIPEIAERIREGFDSCFINYSVNYNYSCDIKKLKNPSILSQNKPKSGEYIWNYIYNTEKLISLLEYTDPKDFDSKANELFTNTTSIETVIYFHNHLGNESLKNCLLKSHKPTVHYTNIIYVGDFCRGTFNGYVSWLKNIGKCFASKYDITILYSDNMLEKTLNIFKKYFTCVQLDNNINYTCDRLLVTHSTFYYPYNIYHLEANYLFIHCIMSEYKTPRYPDDIYSQYIAVSKVSAEHAKSAYGASKIDYICNPFKLDDEDVQTHLRLVSAQRAADVKRIDRVELLASVLDEENVPYTWNLFTDVKENTNVGGLIYRNRISNVLPYIKDSDYFVLLSDSEACPYSIMESLCLHTKVIVTPLDAFKELGVKDGKNAIVIPFEYFDDKEKLKEIVKRMYKEKDKKYKYTYSEKNFSDYTKIFK